MDETLPTGSFTRAMYRTSKGLGLTPADGGSIILVLGPNVYWYKPNDDTYTKLGVISNLQSTVSISDDGFSLVIADGVNLYRMDLTTLVFTNVGFNLIDPTAVVFFGGYVICIGTKKGLPQNTFFWSDLYNSSEWNALSYAQAEERQDPITGIIVNGSYLCLYGPLSFELWSTTGDADNPFQRAYSSSGTTGLYAPKSLVEFGESVYFIGTNNRGNVSAYKATGNQVVKISPPVIDKEWGSIGTSDCTAFSMSEAGHDFIIFNFDLLDKTYCYDIDENMFHERASRDQTTDELHRWTPNYVANTADATICGDRFTQKLYLLSHEYTTENGSNILRVRNTSIINAEQKMLITHAVVMDMLTGYGISDEWPDKYTDEARVMFEYSTSRGHNNSTRIVKSMGATGEYNKSVEFGPLGQARNLSFSFSISDPVNTAILNGFIFYKVGSRGRR